MSSDWADRPEAVPYSQLDNPQSLNLYGYVNNNPLSKADPDGHCSICAYAGEMAAGAGIGAVIGGGVEVVSSMVSHQDVTWANVKGAMVQGAITGAVAAATEGTSLVSQGAAQAGANIVGGLIGRDIAGAKTTKTDVVVDAVSGALSPAIGAKVGSKRSTKNILSLPTLLLWRSGENYGQKLRLVRLLRSRGRRGKMPTGT
jgi:hypothetical protein